MSRLLVVLLLLTTLGCTRSPATADRSSTNATDTEAADPGRTLRIAVIPKGTGHEFWKSVLAGAKRPPLNSATSRLSGRDQPRKGTRLARSKS